MAKKQSKENPDLLQLGQKQRAGQLLSSYIRAIGTEVDQVIIPDTPQGCEPGMPRMVSKAECLARWLWKHALPSKDDEGNYVPPDKDCIRIVLDRAEGKPGIGGTEADAGKESVPDKISRMNQERVNRISAEVTGELDA